MVVFYGQPVDYSQVSMKSYSLSTCIAYCYNMDTCVAVYTPDSSEVCIVFEFGQISTLQQLEASSGKVMGVKMLSANSTNCSTTSDGNSMVTGYQLNNTFYPYSISDTWTFTSGSSVSCQANFTMFVRPLGSWCIGIIPTTTCLTQQDSATQCKSLYGGVLSGLQTLAERDFVAATAQPWLGLQSNFTTYGVWINGARKTSCMETVKSVDCNGTNEFAYSDPLLTAYDGYTWAANQPSGVDYVPSSSNCLNLYFTETTILGIDDYMCNVASLRGELCYKGYACGIEPS
ncbi:C-type lectin domain-containing protein [Caenorhabditis elegans]|uniref:C-type lectin domain-containing protein n=1 Tax=Caenorhabditis elegans TaxID=6239 RepID=Q9NEP2_CAEEL|nr:C-type lectin domain-containing protein [Caenorhabditis elegans]CAB81990.2 C-type lectin domain-containing protein [Caenorhabditis elegans]|eukprot:NP_001355369.1 C-type LECtin [Caenorhabditis elegans]